MSSCEGLISTVDLNSTSTGEQEDHGCPRFNQNQDEILEESDPLNENQCGMNNEELCCIVCASDEIKDWLNRSDKGGDGMNLSEFCNLVKISIPPKSRPLLQNFHTPLCQNCEALVNDIKTILQQIEKLQQNLLETSKKLKEQIALTSKFDGECCDINALRKSSSGIYNAVAFVHHQLCKDAFGNIKTKSKLGTSSVRKKPGRKPNHEKLGGETEMEKRALEKDPTLTSHRSSFGRVVKRPRYLISDSELKINGYGSCHSQYQDAKKDIKPNEFKTEKDRETIIVPRIVSIETHKSSKPGDSSSKGSNTLATFDCLKESEKSHSSVKKSNVNIKRSSKAQKKVKILREMRPVQAIRIIGSNGEVLGTNVINDCQRSKASNKYEMGNTAMKIKCSKCEKTFTDFKKKEEHMKKTHEGNKYQCQQCHTKFSRLRDLFQHKKEEHPPLSKDSQVIIEDGRKMFECEFCKIVFKNLSDLQIHRRKHTGERPFRCEPCNEGFISKGKYEVHVEVKHPEIPPLTCEFCSRGFFRHHRLRDHRNSHTGERPYQCEVCGKSFSQPAYLKYHQTKHKELNLDEFKCDQCERKFASPVNLKFHKETQHQKKYRYHCSVCGHGASHVSHLKLHMRSHTGERPFSCPHCSKTFTRGSQLKIHIRSHTGERPYACLTCSKSFTNSSKLRRHELTHAANKAKRPKEIIKVTSLSETEELHIQKGEMLEAQASATTAVIIPEILEENGQQFVKLEHVQSAISNEADGQQLITIEQANGVTYQVIATNDVITGGEQFAEYIVLNGDFTLA